MNIPQEQLERQLGAMLLANLAQAARIEALEAEVARLQPDADGNVPIRIVRDGSEGKANMRAEPYPDKTQFVG